MELRRIKLSGELKEAREALLNINFATDTCNIYWGVPPASRPYGLVDKWLHDWMSTLEKAYSFLSNGVDMVGNIRNELGGYRQENDPEIFNEIRPAIVRTIDISLSQVDQKYEIRPLLEEYIERVKDNKLAELLKEFNAIKNVAPNFAAMGFRTILALLIQEKAKRVKPTSNTAIRIDLAPQPVIDSARTDQVLSPDETRLINSFVSTHKDIYDFVTHRPRICVDKSEVDTMVDLLNKLLPSIIN